MNMITMLPVLFFAVLALGECSSIDAVSAHQSSPLAGKKLYINKQFRKQVRSSIRTGSSEEKALLRKILKAPTAVWLTSKASVNPVSGSVAKALSSAGKASVPRLITMIVYNLPNRDCSAGASGGEICCSNKNGFCDVFDSSNRCEAGLEEYKKDFIDPLARTVQQYCDKVPMTFVIEPDAVGNLATNTGGACANQATRAAYRSGIRYAVDTLKATCRSATIYVDGAHGGWLGWTMNSEKFVDEIKSMGIASKIRGFSINVSNYQEMGILCPTVGICNGGSNKGHPCCQVDSCNLSSQYNPGFTALNYALSLRQITQSRINGFKPYFIIDTSRNGVGNARKSSCENWCNIRDAGVGRFPTTSTKERDLVDAYMWIKPPGESDGCTRTLPDGSTCSRFASRCASSDSIGSRAGEPRAPDAGGWFDYQIKLLVKNGRDNLD